MRSGHFLLLPVLLFLLGCGTMPPPEPTRPLGSRVELAAGEVWLVRPTAAASGEANRQRLITGAMLPEEATIEVGAGGRCLLRLGTGTGVFFRGGSKAELRGASFSLLAGEVWADVPDGEQELGRFGAGDVVIVASGAGFDLLRRDALVQVYVSRGLAVVTAPGGRTEVDSGEQAQVEGKAAPTVRPVAFWEDWTGGLADRQLSVGRGGRGTGRLYGIDPASPGEPPQELQILSQNVGVRLLDGIAATTVSQSFFNPGATPLEGWYWFTVPEGASVGRFAVEVDGVLVEGEMVERRQAAAAYAEAVRRAFDPALLEWVDGRTFRARIHPIPPAGSRRVVLSYMELLPMIEGGYRYVYPMGGDGEVRIQEFSLNVDLGEEAADQQVATLQEARRDADGRTISMRRSGFLPRSDFLLEVRRRQPQDPLQIRRYSSGGEEADYVMLRYAPDLDWRKIAKVPGDLVVVLDTSAGGDESERQVRADAVEAILRALSAGDRFAVMTADLAPRVLYPEQGLAEATEANIAVAVEKLAEVANAGATDLGEVFHQALQRVHEAEQPAVVYVGDGLATVGELSSAKLAERLRRSLADSRARLFTLAVGTAANHALLERLARVGGGQSLRVDLPEQTVQEALRLVGWIKTPTVTDLVVQAGAGLDQLFSTATGKISEGEEVILLARTHHDLPATITVTGRLGGAPFTRQYRAAVEQGPEQSYIAALWARQLLTHLMGEGLEENRGSVIHLGLNYSLMTPLTSFLVLDSEAAYQQQGIQRRPRPSWGWLQPSPERAPATSTATAQVLQRSQPACGFLFGCNADSPARESRSVSRDEEAARRPMAPPPSSAAGEAKAVAMDDAVPMAGPAPAPMLPRAALAADTAGASLAGGARAKQEAAFGRVAPAPPAAEARRQRNAVEEQRVILQQVDTLIREDATPAAEKKVEDRPRFRTIACSDGSRRSLAQRRILWQSRLARTTTVVEAARVFFEAGQRCELPRWHDLYVLLDLVEQRCRNATEVELLLEAFRAHPRLQSYLRKRILRRTLDPETSLGLFFPSAVQWPVIDQGLAALPTPQARLETLQRLLEAHPDDPLARIRWVQALVEAGRADEARAEAWRLRRDGLAGLGLLQLLCDLEAEAGRIDDARRICSELVEFNPDDPALRQLLGDLFLRHGWHEAAYRQYRTLVDLRPADPTAQLRLALAAAGAGRVDEAMRLQRKVAGEDGESGPHDPRRAARYHLAAQLGRLMQAALAASDAEQLAGLGRSLKRAQVFPGEGTVELVQWEDLTASLDVELRRGPDAVAVAERLLAPETGLVALHLGPRAPTNTAPVIKLQGAPLRRPVSFTRLRIGWNGRSFTVQQQPGTLPPAAREVALAPF